MCMYVHVIAMYRQYNINQESILIEPYLELYLGSTCVDSWLIFYGLYMAMKCMYIHICCVYVGMAYQGSMCVDSWLILYGVYMPMTCTYTHNVCACVCVCVCVLIVDWYYLSLKFTAGMVLEGSMIPVIRPEAFMCVCVLIADRYYYMVWLFLGQGHLPREWRRKAQWFQSSGQRPLEWWCMCALHLDAIVPVCVCVLERECMGVCACVWLCACARYTLMPVYLCVCACVRERERETEREREIE